MLAWELIYLFYNYLSGMTVTELVVRACRNRFQGQQRYQNTEKKKIEYTLRIKDYTALLTLFMS